MIASAVSGSLLIGCQTFFVAFFKDTFRGPVIFKRICTSNTIFQDALGSLIF